ncbi:hypothetical protein ACJJTC_009655 [Scirpophaga incertulas]
MSERLLTRINKTRAISMRFFNRAVPAVSERALIPNSKVNALLEKVDVPPEVRKNLLFIVVLTAQLQDKANTLRKKSKEREVFQKCVSGIMDVSSQERFCKKNGIEKQKRLLICSVQRLQHTYQLGKGSPPYSLSPRRQPGVNLTYARNQSVSAAPVRQLSYG